MMVLKKHLTLLLTTLLFLSTSCHSAHKNAPNSSLETESSSSPSFPAIASIVDNWRGDLPQEVRQTSASIEELFTQSAKTQSRLEIKLKQVTNQVGGSTLILPPDGLKSYARFKEKLAEEEHDDFRLILDVARASIAVARFSDIPKVFNAIVSVYGAQQIVFLKDRINYPTAARYRDFKINIKDPDNQVIFEVLISSKPILDVKLSAGHKLYEETRTIQGRANLEGRDLSASEQLQVDRLNGQAKQLYENAFQRSAR